MKASELMELLKKVDSDKEVYAFLAGQVIEILDVDELSDRIDFNLKVGVV